MYLFLPVTRIFVQYANRQLLRYALILWFILGIVFPTLKPFPVWHPVLAPISQWAVSMPYAAIGYSVLGYYIHQFPLAKLWGYLLTFASGFAVTFGGTYCLSAKSGELFSGFWEGMSVGVTLMAVGLFGFFVVFFRCHPLKHPSAVVFFSKASFCIYLVHLYFLYKFYHWEIGIDFAPYLLSIPSIALLALLLSCLVYCFLRAVPGIRRWLI